MDTRYHFVRQYIKDGTVLIEFVRSHDNDSDIFTKNKTSEIHHQHSEKLIWTKEEYESEARQITTGRVLRRIVNRSATTKQEMPTYDRAIRDMKNGANQYRVLEDSDEEGTYDKVQNVQFNNEREYKRRKLNFIKTVNQPSCELSNKQGNLTT